MDVTFGSKWVLGAMFLRKYYMVYVATGNPNAIGFAIGKVKSSGGGVGGGCGGGSGEDPGDKNLPLIIAIACSACALLCLGFLCGYCISRRNRNAGDDHHRKSSKRNYKVQ